MGDFTLKRGDWVKFVIAVDRRDKLKRATKLELMDYGYGFVKNTLVSRYMGLQLFRLSKNISSLFRRQPEGLFASALGFGIRLTIVKRCCLPQTKITL